MKHLHALYCCAAPLLLGSCHAASQDPAPSTVPSVVVRYTAVGADTVHIVTQIRTYPRAKPDSTARTIVQAIGGVFKANEWWIGKLPAKYDLTASILIPPCGQRKKVLPPGARITLDILVDEKVRRTVTIASGTTLYIPAAQTDITLSGVEL